MTNNNCYKSKNKFSENLTNNTDNYVEDLQYIETSNHIGDDQFLNDYFYSFSSNLNIFEDVQKYLNYIENNQVKNFIIEFIQTFQKILKTIMDKEQIDNVLPPMRITQEDDAIILEWIFKDFRVGFIIENKVNESTWYMITNKNLEEFSISGKLDQKDLSYTVLKIINYVLENT